MYEYKKERPYLFTDEGQRMFLKIRDQANNLANISGSFRLANVIREATGDSFSMLACVDRLVELKEFRYVYQDCSTQDWVLVRSK